MCHCFHTPDRRKNKGGRGQRTLWYRHCDCHLLANKRVSLFLLSCPVSWSHPEVSYYTQRQCVVIFCSRELVIGQIQSKLAHCLIIFEQMVCSLAIMVDNNRLLQSVTRNKMFFLLSCAKSVFNSINETINTIVFRRFSRVADVQETGNCSL